MLATLVAEPFTRSDWVFEEKYDGVRILAYKEGAKVRLISRNAIDRTSRYLEIASSVRELSPDTLALDGEVVVFDGKGISRFQLLQQGKSRPEYAVFDCLYANGEDLRRKPLAERRTVLEKFVRDLPPLILAKRLDADGLRAFAFATGRGLEGILAKDGSSRSWRDANRLSPRTSASAEQPLLLPNSLRKLPSPNGPTMGNCVTPCFSDCATTRAHAR
jgi:bifunctional non-homologous end joining protein LigD